MHPASPQLAPVVPVAPGATLATLNYVIRSPDHQTHDATIDVVPFPVAATQRVDGGFADAIAAAQAAAAVPQRDGTHNLPINVAQGVLQAADGAWWVTPLGGDHRGQVGPAFIDGVFFDRSGLAVWAQRRHGALQAIVGTEQAIDLRRGPASGVQPIASMLADYPELSPR